MFSKTTIKNKHSKVSNKKDIDVYIKLYKKLTVNA